MCYILKIHSKHKRITIYKKITSENHRKKLNKKIKRYSPGVGANEKKLNNTKKIRDKNKNNFRKNEKI